MSTQACNVSDCDKPSRSREPSMNLRMCKIHYGRWVRHGSTESRIIYNRTHCPQGHELTPENTYIQFGKKRKARGWSPARMCRKCKIEKSRALRFSDCHGVAYAIRNRVNDKVYVGITTWAPSRRLSTFKSVAKNPQKYAVSSSPLSRAMIEFGSKNFSIEVLERCETELSLDLAERKWIACLNSKFPNGYNVQGGGIRREKKKKPHGPLISEKEMARHGARPIRISKKDLERFLARIQRGGDGECWLWQGGKRAKGYGRFTITESGKRRNFRAHRLSWKIHFGSIPRGLSVLHHCDVRDCVKPSHLFLGSQRENHEDMCMKGRNPVIKSEWTSKITEEQVKELRKLYIPFSRKFSAPALGRRFGLSLGVVFGAVSGKTWKHVQVEEAA